MVAFGKTVETIARMLLDRLIGHLMVGCIIMVQAHDCIYIVAIKGIYPFAYYFFWS